MGLLKKFFSKDKQELSVEEKEKLNYILDENSNKLKKEDLNQSEENISENSFSIENYIQNLDLIEINRIRNLLDKREEKLTGVSIEDNFSKNSKLVKVSEENIAEKISDDDLNDETYEIDDEFIDDIGFEESKKIENANSVENQEKKVSEVVKEVKENSDNNSNNDNNLDKDLDKEILENQNLENKKVEENIDKKIEKNSIENETVENIEENEEKIESKNKDTEEKDTELDDFIEEVKSIFGEENLFFKKANTSFYEIIDSIPLLYIGIRNKLAFENDDLSDEDQQKWFVDNIKKLSNLKHFKMLESTKTKKDLVWEREKTSVVICFRTCSEISSVDEFNFPL